MRILFAISVVAFVALLWASLSAAQYIRRARRRRTEPGQNGPASAEVASPIPPEISGLELLQERTPATMDAAPPAASESALQPSAIEDAALHVPSSQTPRGPLRFPSSAPASRPEWGHFNHDAGDLSDPAPIRQPRLRRPS